MNNGWIYKLEKKIGKYCIPGLIRYVIAAEIIGAVIGIVNPQIYSTFFSLNFSAILKGQVWRLVTFIFYPEISGFDPWGIMLLLIQFSVYYFIGTALERVWGSFRFNLFYFSGIILSIIAALIIYIFTGIPFWPSGLQYINETLFLAFAVMFPDIQFHLFFLFPVKAKWLGMLYGIFIVYNTIVVMGLPFGYVYAVAIIIQFLNFLFFFLNVMKTKKRGSAAVLHGRQKEFVRKSAPQVVPIFRHRCAICGKTERDDPDLEFRFCSKCEGNYEYCSEHIFTHEHVHR